MTTPKAGDKVEVGPGAEAAGRAPWVYLETAGPKGRRTAAPPVTDGYTLRLTFGDKDADGNLPGTIYLCLPGDDQSFLAGTFTAKVKK